MRCTLAVADLLPSKRIPHNCAACKCKVAGVPGKSPCRASRSPKMPSAKSQKQRTSAEKLLLDFDRSDAVELLGDRSRLVLRHILLQGLGSAVDQVLGFLQAEGGDFAYSLNGADLVRAGILQDDGELGLLFDRRCRCRAAARRGCRNCCRGRNAETLFKLLHQLRRLEEGKSNDLIFQLLNVRHDSSPFTSKFDLKFKNVNLFVFRYCIPWGLRLRLPRLDQVSVAPRLRT